MLVNILKRVFLLLLLLGASPVQAAPARLTWDIYAGGIHVIQTELSLDLSAKTYTADMRAGTRGFLGALVPWKGHYATTGGRGKKASFLPHRHESVSTWKGSDDVATYLYSPGGTFKKLVLSEDGKDKSPDTVDPLLTAGTTDILSATLGAMWAVQAQDRCSYAADIFDSRRRFTLKFVDQGADVLAPSRYGIFSGPARKCTAEVIPGAGAWHKKPRGWLSIQEQGRKKGTLPTLWFASVDPALPPLPVRIMIKTNYGTLFMHLSSAALPDGRVLSLPK